ncbi:MAG: HAD family hydrolase [Firmicutes bacterium]|nr:HAD family hydrolase [Bacillota bacterium]
MSKLHSFDLDGTLLHSDKSISPRNDAAIRMAIAGGDTAVINTGRCTPYANKKLGTLPIRHIIGSNGSQIYDRLENQIIYTDAIDPKTLREIHAACDHHDMMYLMHGPNSLNSINCVNCEDVLEPFRGATPIRDIQSFIAENPVTQFLPISTDPEVILRAREKLLARGFFMPGSDIVLSNQSKHLDCPHSPAKNYTYLDINNRTTNKGAALTKYCEMMNIDPANSIAYGDDMNDMPMFRAAGYRVAMANGTPAIRAAADYITDTNNNDGVAKFMESNGPEC